MAVRDFSIEVFPKANHALVETQTGLTSEMLRSDRFAPGLFLDVAAWLRDPWPLAAACCKPVAAAADIRGRRSERLKAVTDYRPDTERTPVTGHSPWLTTFWQRRRVAVSR